MAVFGWPRRKPLIYFAIGDKWDVFSFFFNESFNGLFCLVMIDKRDHILSRLA